MAEWNAVEKSILQTLEHCRTYQAEPAEVRNLLDAVRYYHTMHPVCYHIRVGVERVSRLGKSFQVQTLEGTVLWCGELVQNNFTPGYIPDPPVSDGKVCFPMLVSTHLDKRYLNKHLLFTQVQASARLYCVGNAYAYPWVFDEHGAFDDISFWNVPSQLARAFPGSCRRRYRRLLEELAAGGFVITREMEGASLDILPRILMRPNEVYPNLFIYECNRSLNTMFYCIRGIGSYSVTGFGGAHPLYRTLLSDVARSPQEDRLPATRFIDPVGYAFKMYPQTIAGWCEAIEQALEKSLCENEMHFVAYRHEFYEVFSRMVAYCRGQCSLAECQAAMSYVSLLA